MGPRACGGTGRVAGFPGPSTDSREPESSVNVSLNLLRSRIPALQDDAGEVARRLRDRGFAVSRIVPLAELLRPIVVGRVESVAQHPNADRLKVCMVDDGTEQ